MTWAYINGTTYLTDNLSTSPSSNLDLVCKNGVQHEGQNKIIVESPYIPMLVSRSSWKVNEVICISHWSGTNIRTCSHKRIYKTQQSKTIMSVLGIMQHPSCSHYLSFYNVSHTNLGSSIEGIWCRHECRYEPNDQKTHARSIIHACLLKFLIKRLYTQLDVVDITFYH